MIRDHWRSFAVQLHRSGWNIRPVAARRPCPAPQRACGFAQRSLTSHFTMDKAALRQAILSLLEAELATLTAAAHDAHAEATDEENRSEDKYDMRSQSAAYLAAGQAKLATELGAAIGAYQTLALPAFGPRDAIATGALVTLEVGGEPTVYFLGPHRGGLEVVIGGQTVVVVTVASPLGRQLVGRHLGESVMLPGRTGPALQKISAVA